MNHGDIDSIVKGLAPAVMAYLSKGLANFDARIKIQDERIEQLEKRLAEVKIPTAAEVAVLIDVDSVAKCAAELVRVPQDGKDAEVDLDALAKAAAALVVVPEVKDGKDAEVDLDALAKAAAALVVVPEPVVPTVDDIVARIPKPENGKDADMDALKTHVGELVKSLPPVAVLPAPSVEEIAGTFERRFSDLTLSWERQARDTFEKAADRMPKPKDGRDALNLEDFDLTLAEDGRTVTVKMQAGTTVIEKSVKIAAVLDNGIYKHDGAYEKGDGVSYGGSFWIAKCDQPKGVPGSGETDWRCAVKKGRDAISEYKSAVKGGFGGSEKDWLGDKLTKMSSTPVVKTNG